VPGAVVHQLQQQFLVGVIDRGHRLWDSTR
jgi:hypothetical protein